jgi:hypothetical protein
VSNPNHSSAVLDKLIKEIESLELEDQRKLLEILEERIFEAEEDLLENQPDVMAEVEASYKAYEAGDFKTIDEYMLQQSEASAP